MPERMPRALRIALSAVLSLSLLAGVVALIDTGALLQRFAALDPLWAAAALLISIPQYLLSAARWRLTAMRLGANLTFKGAVAEYYLAVLTNQLLPGGVLGDAARAVRHGRRVKAHGAALRAVIYERSAGQFALFLVMLAGLFSWPWIYGEGALAVEIAGVVVLTAAACTVMLALLATGWRAETRAGQTVRNFLRDARHALIARDVIARQGLYSFGILATYLACFYCAGRAIGLDLSILHIITLVPAVLFSMNMPLTISGWGVREATAAAIWRLAELAAVDGVAVSVSYGAIVLLSALPGLAVLSAGFVKRNLGDQR